MAACLFFWLQPQGQDRGRERTQRLKQLRENSFVCCLFSCAWTEFCGGALSDQGMTWVFCQEGPFSHMPVFRQVEDLSLPNTSAPSPTALNCESWMRDKDESLYLHSRLLQYDSEISKLFFYLSESSVLTHSFYCTVKDRVKNYCPHIPSPQTVL